MSFFMPQILKSKMISMSVHNNIHENTHIFSIIIHYILKPKMISMYINDNIWKYKLLLVSIHYFVLCNHWLTFLPEKTLFAKEKIHYTIDTFCLNTKHAPCQSPNSTTIQGQPHTLSICLHYLMSNLININTTLESFSTCNKETITFRNC